MKMQIPRLPPQPKPQFTTKSLLLATAFAAVWLAAMGPHFHLLRWLSVKSVLFEIWFANLRGVPFFLAIIFIAYAIGRRSLTWQMVVAFAVAEAGFYAASLSGLLSWIDKLLSPY